MHICKFFCLILVHSSTFQAFVMYNLVYQPQCSSIKFCSYNLVLNKAPYNNDVMHVTNIVLNEAPNSNDSTHVVNNVSFNYHGHTKILNGSYIQQLSCRKVDLPEMRDIDKITRKFVWIEINFPGKKWRLYANSLITRSISVGRQ